MMEEKRKDDLQDILDQIESAQDTAEETPQQPQLESETETVEKQEPKPAKGAQKKERAKNSKGEAKEEEPVEPEIVVCAEDFDKLSAELDNIKDKLLRTAAEYDNYRKRTEREKLESAGNGAASAIEKLLPAMDALERAVSAESKDADYKKGVEMTLGMFVSALERIGVKEIDALGKPFDPHCQNAVQNLETDEYQSGDVAMVLQKGYKLGERVIRPAMVAVAQ